MKLFSHLVITVILLTGCTQFSWAQFGGGPPEGRRPERLEKFRKMRLVEVLKLNEDESVRFFAKQSAHEDKMHDLMKTRNTVLDDLDNAVRSQTDTKKIDQLSNQVLDLDQKIFAERRRFQDEIHGFLTPDRFAKYLVFERNFQREVREALDEMRQGKRDRIGQE